MAIGLVVAAAVVTLVAGLCGGRTIVIGGASMEGSLPRGSLAVIVPVSAHEPLVGQPVTVRLPHGGVLTHRVIREVRVATIDYLETQGDAVGTPDPALVPRSAVIGRVAADVPLLGYAVVELQRPAGWLVLLGMIAMLYASGVLLRSGKPAGGPRSSSGVGRA